MLRPRAVEKPLLKSPVDFLVARPGMVAAETLALHGNAGLEQIERRAKRLGYGCLGTGLHMSTVRRGVRLGKLDATPERQPPATAWSTLKDLRCFSRCVVMRA